jgi:large subunit ribosomal protein L19e
MDLRSQKRIAAKIMKCGVNRIKVTVDKEAEEALTREDIRGLIRKGLVRKTRKKGTSRAEARKRLEQKKKGRRMGPGSKKGSIGAGTSKKREWIRRVKPMRAMLRMLRDTGQMERSDYRKTIMMVKGGMFRNKKHMYFYIKEHEMIKKPEKAAAKKPAKKKVVKKAARAAPRKAKGKAKR